LLIHVVAEVSMLVSPLYESTIPGYSEQMGTNECRTFNCKNKKIFKANKS